MTLDAKRTTQLARLLREIERDVRSDLQLRIRRGRTERTTDGLDDLEHTDADSVEDLAFSILQMRAELVARIGQALERLGAGRYGRCVECDEDIPVKRLRALPVAIRCLSCESRREFGAGHPTAHGLAPRRLVGPRVRWRDSVVQEDAQQRAVDLKRTLAVVLDGSGAS